MAMTPQIQSAIQAFNEITDQQCNWLRQLHRSRSHDAVIRVCDASGNVIETHEHAGDFKEW
jgi:hypothetical protein